MRDVFLKITEAAEKESHTGYGDYAVFGGFSAFVEELLKDREDDGACIIRGAVRHYANSNLQSRKAIVELILKIAGEYLTEAEVEVDDAPVEAAVVSESQKENKEVMPELPKAPVSKEKKNAAFGDVCYLKGVGPKKAELLQRLGIHTPYDLCEYFPYRHEDRRIVTPVAELFHGEMALVSGYVDRIEASRLRGNRQILKARLTDSSGSIYIAWFNQPWLKQKLHNGSALTVYGKAELLGDLRSMTAIEYECVLSAKGLGILPVYKLTAGLNQKTMRKLVSLALSVCCEAMEDFLPPDFRREHHLEERSQAILHYHHPDNFEELQRSHRRLVFEEFFLYRLSFDLDQKNAERKGIAMEDGTLATFLDLLPFAPTGAQHRAMTDIYRDMAAPLRMNRLLEGDVGSGKTVVAAAAVYRCVCSGHQCALMAPTEILAEQHYRSMQGIFAGKGISISLLTGSTKAAEKRRLYEDLKTGEVHLVIGTHALLEHGAEFWDLALVIIDEQHRFGVNQRNALFRKGNAPDMLVMTATPIPRTLAMTVFSGLDLSILDEMPPGRKPIRTIVISDKEEDRAIRFMKKHVAAGHQCYVVCPLVEEGENQDVEAATVFYERLAHVEMRELSVGLVHGKMKARDKDAVLRRFRDNEISVLVATTVIEVGIDVPNAAVMYVKNADRFGLAQLHQIRGRVGRGDVGSTCILQYSGKNETTVARMKIMAENDDGFRIAEEDLKLRGPGDFLGVRQHGLPELNLADLFRDHEMLEEAAAAVGKLLEEDPELSDPKWEQLKQRLNEKTILQ